jgi:hypothetical protein
VDEEEREFQRLWGPWAQVAPPDAAAAFDGFTRPWWISGGWAIEAFTGVSRPHKDVDVTVFRRDVGALREQFRGRYDLWAAGSGTIRPLDDNRPRVPPWSGQIWLREHALAPGLLDVQLNPGGPRTWIYKRDRSVTVPLAEATWVAPDGVRYLRPELVLAHKVMLRRPTDDVDFEATVPLLDRAAREWLASYVASTDPRHPWRQRLRRRSQEKSVRAG